MFQEAKGVLKHIKNHKKCTTSVIYFF